MNTHLLLRESIDVVLYADIENTHEQSVFVKQS